MFHQGQSRLFLPLPSDSADGRIDVRKNRFPLFPAGDNSGSGRRRRVCRPLKYGHRLTGRHGRSPLFHHAQGHTPGFLAFADQLRRAGHTVHTPVLYDGHTFASLDRLSRREEGRFRQDCRAGEGGGRRPPDSFGLRRLLLGVMPAQSLAQTRPGAKGPLINNRSV